MGNMSKTYIDNESGTFVKEDCNETGFEFQQLLYHTLVEYSNFAINQPIGILNGKAKFELLEDIDFEITKKNSTLFGINMARIHNLSAKLMSSKELPYMDNKIMPDVNSWKELNLTPGELSIREIVMKFAKYKPIKTLPLHRDFRLHNIVYDGRFYNLIDFDFAAYDDVSMEVMGMVVDLLDHGIEYVEAFLTAYMESSNIDTYDNMATNYLIYLASSCFPYDRRDTLEPEAFENLRKERQHRLISLYTNIDNINKIISK